MGERQHLGRLFGLRPGQALTGVRIGRNEPGAQNGERG